MKTQITISAKDFSGTNACLSFEVDAQWLAFHKRDIKKVKKFHPHRVFQIIINTEKASLFQPIAH